MKTKIQVGMKTLGRTQWIAIVIALMFALSACGSGGSEVPDDTDGPPLDVAGEWSGTATTVGECDDCGIMFDLVQDGTEVTGTSIDSHNAVTIDLSGTIVGSTLTLTHVGAGDNTIVHDGEVDGDTIAGTIDGVNDEGTTLSGTFTVTRGSENVEGSWSGTATTADCEDCGITYDLEQDGTAVTGTSTDQFNDITIDLDGTLIGTVLTLTHDAASGNTIVHTGDVAGDVITGTLEGVNDEGTALDGTFDVTRD